MLTKEEYDYLMEFIRKPEVWRVKGAGQIAIDFEPEVDIEVPAERLAILDE
jgi:hypothetical protein